MKSNEKLKARAFASAKKATKYDSMVTIGLVVAIVIIGINSQWQWEYTFCWSVCAIFGGLMWRAPFLLIMSLVGKNKEFYKYYRRSLLALSMSSVED